MNVTAPRRAVRAAMSIAVAAATAVALALGSATLTPLAARADDTIPTGHLLAAYDFEGITTSTTVLTDRSGNGRNATIVNPANGGAVNGAGGAGTTALNLPGGAYNSTGTYVTLPYSILQARADVSVSMRVNYSGSSTAWQWLLALGRSSSTQYAFVSPRNGDGFFRTAATLAGSGGEATITGSAAMPAGWKTVTLTLDSVNHTLTTYLDGVAVGTTTVAATMTGAQLVAGTTTRSGYIGKSFYNDPLFQGQIDDVKVYDLALTQGQVQTLVTNTIPTPVAPAQTTVEVSTAVGTAPVLPATISSTYTDGYTRPAPVTWNTVSSSQYAQRGTFTVDGLVGSTAVTATVHVTLPGELNIDLATTTGAFDGGASGTLYGLYGEGLPSNNLIEGIDLQTVATKAQDGPQHPGADALEVLPSLADSSGGDVYIYMTDIHRGFPYQWTGSTPAEKLSNYMDKMAIEVDQVLTMPQEYQDRVVFVPYNEPEGNMFGTGTYSYNNVSWLTNPSAFFSAWDQAYTMIKGKMPNARIAGPNTSVLYPSNNLGFLQHTVAANTVPQVMTWHELSNPASIRTNVALYRQNEITAFAGTSYQGTVLPINIDEYAFNYHTSVPGQMIQWISGIEDSKVDADIAYWNIDGNISDSAVQTNRGNGQWWLLNAYAAMEGGDTVKVTPPSTANYTLQGVAAIDTDKAQVRALFGGGSGTSNVVFDHVDTALLGTTVHATISEIGWTGQIGDSSGPAIVAEVNVPVVNGAAVFSFDGTSLPQLKAESAYSVVITPGANAANTAVAPTLFKATYEAEAAAHTGTGWSQNALEGSPADVSKFYTSGGYDVGGLRTGSNVVLNFSVTVPTDGNYDLSVFASTLNTYSLAADQGPTNVFLRVDGAAEQQLFLPLGYKWVVWDHTDTKVALTAGTHTISLAAQSIDGVSATKGDTIIDKTDLSLANPAAAQTIYEGEYATLDGATADYSNAGVSASGVAAIESGDSATFWVYSKDDGESSIYLDTLAGGTHALSVNGAAQVLEDGKSYSFLRGGVNKVVVTGVSGTTLLDRLRVENTQGVLIGTSYEAETATLAGTATVTPYLLASGGNAVTGVGGDPGNANTLTFTNVHVDTAGTYAMTVRYSNEEQSPATQYNPDPVARPADISVNGAASFRVLFAHSFHQDNFWELTIPVTLTAGDNTIAFSSEEATNFDGTTYISDVWTDIPLRSNLAPNLDKITITPLNALVNIVAGTPTVTGTLAVGNELTADPGTWDPSVTLAYQWLRDGDAIEDATDTTYTLTADDVTASISVRVTGTKEGHDPVSIASAVQGPVVEGTLAAGTVTISGSPEVGETLTAEEGTWAPAGVTFTYQWQVAGVDVDGETGSTYEPTFDDAGKVVSVLVTGSLNGYTSETRTGTSDTVSGTPVVTVDPSISGTPKVGVELTANHGTWNPGTTTFTYQWLVNGAEVTGETAETFTPRPEDAGKPVSVKVTGTAPGTDPHFVVSAATANVAETEMITGTPTITGSPVSGQVLTASVGTWTPSDATFSYQWKAGGTVVQDSAASTYTVTEADAGTTITVTVTATRIGYVTDSATSAATAVVTIEPYFADVPSDSLFFANIQWMYAQGISLGTPQTSGKPLYKPADSVSRQAMAVFLYRLSGETFTAPTETTFADVPTDSTFFTAIEWMASKGITVGTPQSSGKPLYKPADPVSRQSMAVFLARYAGAPTSGTPTTQSFADVPTNASTAAAIQWMATSGIATGTPQSSGLPLFKPADAVSRQAMAAFLYRLGHLE